MGYDFDEIIDRRGTDCEKWDGLEERFGELGPDPVSMWVADMDFKAPPAVVEALTRRAEHGIYGYTGLSGAFRQACVSWLSRRHGWEIEPEWIRYSPGVVSGLSMLIQAFTKPGDRVLYQPPVYPPVFLCPENNGRIPVASPLRKKNGRYEMDYKDLERKLAEGCAMAVLCSPHNPGGRVWSREELSRFTDLCLRYGAVPVSDEIHHDLVFAPHKHVPLGAISKEAEDACAVCLAPSKTFNVAGLQTSCIVIKNPKLRERFAAAQKANAVFDPSPFGALALATAYNEGAPWLDALMAYLADNLAHLRRRLGETLPDFSMHAPEATHLAWIDCSSSGLSDAQIKERLIRKAGLVLNMGPNFGPGGQGFVRLNFACPRATLDAGIDRFVRAFAA